jgi:hypothetical protein
MVIPSTIPLDSPLGLNPRYIHTLDPNDAHPNDVLANVTKTGIEQQAILYGYSTLLGKASLIEHGGIDSAEMGGWRREIANEPSHFGLMIDDMDNRIVRVGLG